MFNKTAYYVTICSAVFIIPLLFFNKSNFLEKYRAKFKMYYQLACTFLQYKLGKINVKSDDFAIISRTKCAIVTYGKNDKKCKLCVPYDRRLALEMTTLKAFLIPKNGKVKYDITQQPGIPYLINPQEIGCKSIDVENEENGKKFSYIDVPPMYCKEVH